MRRVRNSDGSIDWWGLLVYVAIFGALIFALNDVTGVVQTPRDQKITKATIQTLIHRYSKPGVQGIPGITITGPHGPRGPAGARGPAGRTGGVGARGAVGPAGAPGTAAARGRTGARGPAGPRGAQGPRGARGSPGPQGPAGQAGATVDQVIRSLCARLPIC